MLVHICCSVDSHYFLTKLREDYKNKEIIGFFYNPNIHPFSEYQLRLIDVKRSCSMLDIKLIDDEYDLNSWFNATSGYEKEPEKGERCNICFNLRFQKTASKAKELGINSITSTLLVSPKKSLSQLGQEGQKIAQKYNVNFITPDYRKNNGTQEQSKIAKQNVLYKQNYCGCLYALNEQRETQKKIPYELINPISKQIMPSSIQSKLNLYEHRKEIEENNQNYRITKSNFLNYRLLRGVVKVNNISISSHILYFSILKQKKAKYYIDYTIDNIHYLNRNNIRLMDIDEFNKRLNTKYKNTNELMFNAPKIEKEINLRRQIDLFESINPIIVIDEIQDVKYEVSIDSQIFQDIKENLVII